MELVGGMAEATLGDDYYVQFEAIDPTTGDPVAGVTVAHATLLADTGGAADGTLSTGPLMLVPGLTPTAG